MHKITWISMIRYQLHQLEETFTAREGQKIAMQMVYSYMGGINNGCGLGIR